MWSIKYLLIEHNRTPRCSQEVSAAGCWTAHCFTISVFKGGARHELTSAATIFTIVCKERELINSEVPINICWGVGLQLSHFRFRHLGMLLVWYGLSITMAMEVKPTLVKGLCLCGNWRVAGTWDAMDTKDAGTCHTKQFNTKGTAVITEQSCVQTLI